MSIEKYIMERTVNVWQKHQKLSDKKIEKYYSGRVLLSGRTGSLSIFECNTSCTREYIYCVRVIFATYSCHPFTLANCNWIIGYSVPGKGIIKMLVLMSLLQRYNKTEKWYWDHVFACFKFCIPDLSMHNNIILTEPTRTVCWPRRTTPWTRPWPYTSTSCTDRSTPLTSSARSTWATTPTWKGWDSLNRFVLSLHWVIYTESKF